MLPLYCIVDEECTHSPSSPSYHHQSYESMATRRLPSAEDITLENEEYEDEIIQAHNTQDAIGWNNCFHTQAIHVVSY